MGALKQYNQATPLALFTPSEITSSKSVMVVDPTSSEDRTIFFTDTEITVSEMQAVLVGSATPSVTWTIRYASDRSAAGTEVVTGGTTTTGTTSGSNVTTLDSGTIPADRWVWLETTAQSGTVTQLDVTVKFGAPVGGGGGTPLDYAAITWTTIPTIDGSDIDIYLSAAGNDSNNGLTTGTPKLTFAAAHALIRAGHGDRLHCRAGDTFTASMGNWNKSGASSARRIIIDSYGAGARPILNSGSGNFFNENAANATGPAHIMFLGVKITAASYTGTGGPVAFGFYSGATSGSSDIVWEDCEISNYYKGIVTVTSQDDYDSPYYGFAPDRHSDFTVRGCIFTDIWATATDSQAQAIYTAGLDGLLIEWSTMCRTGITAAAQYGVHNHNVYIHNNSTQVVYRYNLALNAIDNQVRCGAEVHHNVSSKCVVAWEFGMGTYPEVQVATGSFEDNVVLDSGDNAATILSYGVRLGNLNGATISRNIFVGCNATDPRCLWMSSAGGSYGATLAMTNCQVEDNIVYNFGGIGISMGSGTVGTDWNFNTLKRNHIQNPTNSTVWWLNSGNHAVAFLSGMSGTHWDCADNRIRVYTSGGYPGDEYNRGNGGPGGPYYDIGSGGASDWFTHFGDATTTNDAVTYANAAGATLGHFWTDELGETDLGTETDNHAACVAAMLTQSKATWDDHLTAAAVQFYIATCMTEVP